MTQILHHSSADQLGAELAGKLRSEFTTPFQVWRKDNGAWILDFDHGPSLPEQVLVRIDEEKLDGVCAAGSSTGSEAPLTEKVGVDQHLLLVPCMSKGKPVLVAAGVVEGWKSEIACRLAHYIVREIQLGVTLASHQHELEAYVTQISDDFEELTLLRGLAERLEMTDTHTDLLAMARTLLPLLVRTVKAESVAMVLAQQLGDGREGFEVAPMQPVVWGSAAAADDDVCRRLIEEFGEQATHRCVVKNFFDETDAGKKFPGIRDFVLAPIAKVDHTMGWLLAINRVFRSGYDNAGLRTQLSQFEFGTPEASLLSSVAAMLATHARNVEQFREKEELLVEMVRSLVSAIEAKDDYTSGHSERVALYAERLGHVLGLNEQECEKLYLTGLVHDVGKIGISEETLTKPGRLSEEEFEEIKRHPDLGWGILHDLKQLAYVLPGVVHHHERVDGRGYPDGLSGEEIPRDGRILAIADAYDAMTSDRPYRKGMSPEKAESILCEGAGTQWDADMVTHFMRIMPEILAIQRNYQEQAPAIREESMGQNANSDVARTPGAQFTKFSLETATT